MLEDAIKTMIVIGLAVLLGIIAGNGAVYAFNKFPAKWLCDYKEEPGQELLGGRQRITSHPWKAVFSMFFVLAGIKLAFDSPGQMLPAMVAMWALLEIAIADIKYLIIPDQLVILIAVAALGFIPYYASYWDPVFGACLAFLCMLLVSFVGKLLFKKDTMGFGDVKLFGAVGLLLGFYGAGAVLIATSFLSCLGYSVQLLRKKIKKGDMQPLGPYIAAATILYLLFFNV